MKAHEHLFVSSKSLLKVGGHMRIWNIQISLEATCVPTAHACGPFAYGPVAYSLQPITKTNGQL